MDLSGDENEEQFVAQGPPRRNQSSMSNLAARRASPSKQNVIFDSKHYLERHHPLKQLQTPTANIQPLKKKMFIDNGRSQDGREAM